MLTASVCTIGDEILIGQIVDTNSFHIAQELNLLGIKVQYMLSVGDDHGEIIDGLRNCLAKTDIVITTGGLGPTKDDITKDALRQLSFSDGYRNSEEQFSVDRHILSQRGIPLSENNRAQAMVPDNAEVIVNKIGTAPIMAFPFDKVKLQKLGINSNITKMLYSMPGVPFETISALPDVCNHIKAHFDLDEVEHRTVETFGIAESTLSDMIAPWENALPKDLHLAYLPNPTLGVRLRLSYYGMHDPDAKKRIDAEFDKLYGQLGEIIYGEGNDDLQTVIGRMLREKGCTMSVAESCTGGHISGLITSVAGCSDYYKGSVTSYANQVKTNVLEVDPQTIERFGAVSSQCVEQMATGVLKVLDSDYSVATSGIAGPGGGSTEKPVGLCWIGVAHRERKSGAVTVKSKSVRFSSTRAVNIERFSSYALDYLRSMIIHS
ncbi:MAG: CinA family nicotinamide mononucleotide deamidase-related protein [Bacteroidales bacterium]|jgi:nicotinamide-nucleotide amidase|nr:CinA family nicotinamide mononucleotide deamidase-related protein [Bacteroidales bacterium]MCI2122060.1 CinA family nicotinamide mononucleotide deamidase-related protein [Bacteroidales bacterium]MCI2146199.1 CinA family nicotinamide mononucleotide deamidase-related protein [Bacteroidales bacterium]